MSIERELLGRWHNGDLLPEEYMQLMKETKELLAQPEQFEQEPVAWKGRRYGNLLYEDHGDSIPLYTAPPKREPLTPQQISEGNQSMLNVTREAFKQGVIFAEQQHGITGVDDDR